MVSKMAVFNNAKALFENLKDKLNNTVLNNSADNLGVTITQRLNQKIKNFHKDAYSIKLETRTVGGGKRKIKITPESDNDYEKAFLYEFGETRKGKRNYPSVWLSTHDEFGVFSKFVAQSADRHKDGMKQSLEG